MTKPNDSFEISKFEPPLQSPEQQAERERLILAIEDIIWRHISLNTRLPFDVLRELIQKETSKKLGRCDLGDLLWTINERAWALDRCLPSSYVLWEKGLPGRKFFAQVHALNALPRFIAGKGSKRKTVRYLQNVAYNIACILRPEDANSEFRKKS